MKSKIAIKKMVFDQVVTDFLNSQKPTTKGVYKTYFRYIPEFTGMNGKELLESKKNDKDFLWEKKVVEMRHWLKANGMSDSGSKNVINVLRSFFVYYRTPLVFTRQEINKVGAKSQRVTQDYFLTNLDISKMVFVANLREKYILLGGKSFGLRASDFLRLTYGSFRSINLNGEAPIFLGETNTIKEGVAAFPFVDSDLQPVLKAILEANPSAKNNERILTFQEEELTTIMQALAKKANIELGGKHLRFHCLRKFLIDRLSTVMSSEKWKQIIGKAVSESAYVSTFELADCYKLAMPKTTISTNGNGKVSKQVEEIQFQFQLTKSQLADVIAKQGIDKVELQAEIAKLHAMLRPIIENYEEIAEFLQNRREEKEAKARVEADRQEQEDRRQLN